LRFRGPEGPGARPKAAQLGRDDDALASLEEAIGLGLDEVAAYHKRGETLVTLGKLQEAIVSFDEALKRDARCAGPVWRSPGAVQRQQVSPGQGNDRLIFKVQ
jgi:hypothetical protein